MILGYSQATMQAVFVLALALFLSVVIAGLVVVIANNVGLSNAKTLAKIAQYSINTVGFLKALEILGISSAIIVASFSVIVGAVGLAFAIAFGLGCKDIAADFLAGIFKGK
jgi:small-conductance mechanosensitive channel